MSARSEHRPIGYGPTYELASWGQRLSAAVLDFLVNLIPAVAVFWLLNAWSLTHGHFLIHASYSTGPSYSAGHESHGYGLSPFGLIVWLLIVSLSWGVLMGRSGTDNGQTLGMRRAGVRVVADDGYELSGLRALMRFLLQAALLLLFILPGLLDALWALIDPEHRTWHDIACRTHVVRTASPPPTWRPSSRP